MAANLSGLNDRVRAIQEEFAQRFPHLMTSSGYRDPKYNASVNGAKGSQHIHGNAFDYVPGKDVTDAQKLEALQWLRSQGAKGFGTYNDGSFHVDWRSTPTARGPTKRSASLPQTPAYFQEFARGLLSGKPVPQPTVQVASNSPTVPVSAPAAAPAAAVATKVGPLGYQYTVTPQDYFKDRDISTLPAGMRNNNPGNIKFVGQKSALGPSANTDQGDPQAVYGSPQAGFDAMGRLIVKRFDEGRNTVNSLIAAKGGWTPGNTSAAANVAKTMGLDPNATLNLRDPAQLQSYMRALTLQEHGPSSKLYGDDLFKNGATVALGGTVAPAAPQPVDPWSEQGKLNSGLLTGLPVPQTSPAFQATMPAQGTPAGLTASADTPAGMNSGMMGANFASVFNNPTMPAPSVDPGAAKWSPEFQSPAVTPAQQDAVMTAFTAPAFQPSTTPPADVAAVTPPAAPAAPAAPMAGGDPLSKLSSGIGGLIKALTPQPDQGVSQLWQAAQSNPAQSHRGTPMQIALPQTGLLAGASPVASMAPMAPVGVEPIGQIADVLDPEAPKKRRGLLG